MGRIVVTHEGAEPATRCMPRFNNKNGQTCRRSGGPTERALASAPASARPKLRRRLQVCPSRQAGRGSLLPAVLEAGLRL